VRSAECPTPDLQWRTRAGSTRRTSAIARLIEPGARTWFCMDLHGEVGTEMQAARLNCQSPT
jgi:hypothetical protein